MQSRTRSPNTVTILIPAYGGAERLKACLLSLASYVPQNCRIYVVDDGTPDDSIGKCCLEVSLPNLVYFRSDTNRGFVATCNWGWSHLVDPTCDLLLLNSDTEATSGFLDEMLRVLYCSERHGVVTPRSNNATLFSVPLGVPDIPPEESYRIWLAIRNDLPAYRIMPTAVGFCMLIKAIVLERFGLFDDIYSPGYNEENDLVCRINRCGYSAVVANHAFVFHYESSTFGHRRGALEKEHRQLLLQRFPEYPRKIQEYMVHELDPVEKFAPLLRRHRPALLFDLFHLPAKHSGTSSFALNLLREMRVLIEDEWDLFIGISEQGRFFVSELNGYRIFEDRSHSDILFDLVFKPSQIFTWHEFMRMNRLAPRLSFVLQDIIAVRCDYLTSVERKTIFRKTLELADQVYTISRFSHEDCEAFFNNEIPVQIIHHGTDSGMSSAEFLDGEYVLVVGNGYAHKAVNEALGFLMDIGPVRVIGGDAPPDNLPSHVLWFTSGTLTRSHMRDLMARASLLVYPSHYEGYGLPILDALSLGKQVIALDSQINRELSMSFNTINLTLLSSFHNLKQTVISKLHSGATDGRSLTFQPTRWKDVAVQYVEGLQSLLNKPPDVHKLRARADFAQVLNSARHV